jgi:hypothetical protein
MTEADKRDWLSGKWIVDYSKVLRLYRVARMLPGGNVETADAGQAYLGESKARALAAKLNGSSSAEQQIRVSELVERDGKLIVPVEYLRWLYAERQRINAAKLEDIVWTENGKPWNIDPEEIEEFRFTGLNNCDFVIANYTTMTLSRRDADGDTDNRETGPVTRDRSAEEATKEADG